MTPAWLRQGGGRALAVLGADGFIGSHVVRLALGADWHVSGLCAKSPWRLADLGHDDLRLAERRVSGWSDEQNARQLREFVAASDAVVMLGYEPPPLQVDRTAFELAMNAEGVRRVASYAAREGTPLVFTSSADVYGDWRAGKISEFDDAAPVSPYAQAKLAAEGFVWEAPISSSNVRLATVFGPGENGPRAVPSFIRAYLDGGVPTIHGDGSDVKDYVRVEDVAAGILNACAGLVSSQAIPAVLNLGSGVGRTTVEILESVATQMNVEPRRTHQPVQRPAKRVVLNPELAGKHLGFSPIQDLAQPLRAEVAWLDGHIRRGSGRTIEAGAG